jgi:hypothetical protein
MMVGDTIAELYNSLAQITEKRKRAQSSGTGPFFKGADLGDGSGDLHFQEALF